MPDLWLWLPAACMLAALGVLRARTAIARALQEVHRD